MLEEQVIESAQHDGQAVQAVGVDENDVEIFYLRNATDIAVTERQHPYGSARCGWVHLAGAVYCVFIATFGGQAIISSSPGIPFADFLMMKPGDRLQLADAQRQTFEKFWDMLEEQINLAVK